MVLTDQYWKPSREVRRAIARGDRKVKEASDGRVGMEIARQRMQNDARNAIPLQKIVTEEIKRGTNIAYLSVRYGLPLDRLERYKTEHERREALRAERLEKP